MTGRESTLAGILALVMSSPPSRLVILSWTAPQQFAAEDWATREVLRMQGNSGISRNNKPEFLAGWK